MTTYIIHLQKFTNYFRSGRYNPFGQRVQKRVKIKSDNLMDAYNKSISLNPGFEVSMIWPE